MTHQTSKRQKRSASKAASRTIGTGTRDRPVTMSINVADGRRHHGRGLPKYHTIKAVAEALGGHIGARAKLSMFQFAQLGAGSRTGS